jgi:hypothetical protein
LPVSRNNVGFQLNMDISEMFTMNGTAETISQGNAEDYRTNILYVLPLSKEGFRPGEYPVELGGNDILIRLSEVLRPEHDVILQAGRNLQIGTPGTGFPTLPFQVFTDNRGEYPASIVETSFSL